MNTAMDIGIDAFALNCASVDSYTPTQLALAYQAAEEVGFKVCALARKEGISSRRRQHPYTPRAKAN